MTRQVFADGTSRVVPRSLVRGFHGFRDFFRLQVSRGGDVVTARQFDWCPGGWDIERINDDGPFEPRFPQGCFANPFTLGMVTGIDRGWAVPVLQGARLRLAPGRYRFRLRIAPDFRQLFQIPDGAATITVYGTVKEHTSRAVPPAPDPGERLAPIPTMTDPPSDSLPDLIPLPAFAIDVQNRPNRSFVTFAANVWDRGPAPLVVEGFRRPDSMRMDAFQYFSRDGHFIGRARVGEFHFDRRHGHHHWHFEQFARYRLLDAHGHGVVRSHKQSFCLAPTDAIDMTVRGALWRPEQLGFTQCGGDDAIWTRERCRRAGATPTTRASVVRPSTSPTCPTGATPSRCEPTRSDSCTTGRSATMSGCARSGCAAPPATAGVEVPPWHGIRPIVAAVVPVPPTTVVAPCPPSQRTPGRFSPWV